ncbi:MAG: malonyl-ACP O-methyltransferase BioC [Halothiobacillaceae bacterium]|nr:MAG: malonyl-ACP O-methyltransferase BioC [Halothiobacillaceae bacterium]
MHEYALEKARVRRSFDAAAGHYEQHARLQKMVRDEMLDRLEWIKVDPSVVVDLGCGTGAATRALRKRYPRAGVLGLDISTGMLAMARAGQPWLRKPHLVCADMERLPLGDASVDLLFSSLTLQWSNEPERVFAEARRVLKPGGVFVFSTLGPDSLHELRNAWREADPAHTHVNLFYDMHDVGDALLRAGLRDPVMDVERLTLGYPDVEAVMRSLKGIGARNGLAGRSRGLTGKGRLERVRATYEQLRNEENQLPVSYEVIHGQAWGGEPGRYRADAFGEVRIPLSSLKR